MVRGLNPTARHLYAPQSIACTRWDARMTARIIEAILVEWRAAEVVLGEKLTDADLADAIDALRAEHAAAVELRRAEAREPVRATARPGRTTGQDRSRLSALIPFPGRMTLG